MTQDQLKLIEDALCRSVPVVWTRKDETDRHDKALEIVRQALAQPEPAIGDIRALKHRIHELEGELIGCKRLLDAQPEFVMESANFATNFVESKHLAKPEQQPVAWMYKCGGDTQINTLPPECYGGNWTRTPLYTAPPTKQWVGLTDEEFKFIASKYLLNREAGLGYFQEEIEAKLKEKNNG